MWKKTLIPLAVLGFGLTLYHAVAQEKKAEESPAVEAFKIDPIHSSILFRVKHLDVSYFYGRFNEVSGTVALDAAHPENSKIDVQVAADSVDTHNDRRNADVKGPDFLNVVEFPAISFKSKSIKKLDGDKYQAEGDFTLHGVTKPLTVEFEKTGEGKDPRGNLRIGGITTFTIKRSDYNITFMPKAVGEEIQITVSLEAVGPKSP